MKTRRDCSIDENSHAIRAQELYLIQFPPMKKILLTSLGEEMAG